MLAIMVLFVNPFTPALSANTTISLVLLVNLKYASIADLVRFAVWLTSLP
jgi:hypothetical protein